MKRSPLFVALLSILLVPAWIGSALAFDLGNHRTEVKTPVHSDPGPEGFDSVEGGETIATAIPIASLPFNDTGATCDNVNDYDETCPFSGSSSPDVVYSWVADATGTIDIDLCGSEYDTKVYVYEDAYTPGTPYACNDDYYSGAPCGTFVSAILGMPVTSGNTYYIVVDGYSGACGSYEIEVRPHAQCQVICNGVPEGEPPLATDYYDDYNGGCNSTPFVHQYLYATDQGCLDFCGKSGWYVYDGQDYRDTDWFVVEATGDSITWSVTSEWPVYMFLLSPNDCNSVGVAISVSVDTCGTGTMTFPTTPGEEYWLWVGPQSFTGPESPYEFDYALEICGITGGCEASQPTLVLGDVRTVDYSPPFWEVQVRLTNNGAALALPGKAYDVSAEMGSDLAWLQIPDPTCYYGNLDAGEHSYGVPGDSSYVFDLTNWPGGSFNAWFDVVYIDSCEQRHMVHLDPDFFDPEQATGVGAGDAPIAATRLLGNRPNPFNPQTTISLEIPRATRAEITIFNTAGQLVRRLYSGDLDSGAHTFLWSGKDDRGNAVPSGAYFYRLRTDEFTATKRMTLVR